MLTIKSEHPYSGYHFERKFQAKISPYNKISEKPEEKLIEFKGEQQMEPNMFSSEHIQNEVLTLTSETPSSEYCFDTRLQAKFEKTDQIFEQSEEELIYLIEQQYQ